MRSVILINKNDFSLKQRLRHLCKYSIFAKIHKDCPKIATSRSGGGLAKMQRCHFRLGYISIIYRQTGRPNLCYAIASFFESSLRLCAIFATSLRYLCCSIENSSTKAAKHLLKKRPNLGLKFGRIFGSFHDLFRSFTRILHEMHLF